MDSNISLRYLLLLALPVACVSWTVTHEEVFREPRDYCKEKAETVQAAAGAEVLLPVYVRVLLLALCGAVFSGDDAVHAAV